MPSLKISGKDRLQWSLYVICVLFSTLGFGQHQISVTVEDVKNNEGKLNAALYDTADTFLKFDAVFASTSARAEMGTTVLLFEDVPAGTYGIALYHDENGNNEMDTNWMGIPKEKVAFSNAKMKTFGPPNFEECSFTVSEDTALVVRF